MPPKTTQDKAAAKNGTAAKSSNGAADGGASDPAKKRQTKAAVEKVARSYFDAVARRDADGMAEHWHADGIEDIVPLGVFRGPEGVRSLFREMFTAVPDMEFTVDAITADSKAAAVRWRAEGTFTGGVFQGLEPTGGRLVLRGCDVIEVEDGKLTRNTAFYDGADFARGVGMLPARDSGGERAMKTAFNATTKARKKIDSLRNR